MPTNPPRENDQDNMVLRTVYFPVEMDEQLKLLAFNSSTSKGELIRRAVSLLMSADPEAHGSEPPSTEQDPEASPQAPADQD